MAAFPPAESAGEREFHQACAESVRRSLEGRRRLHAQIDALLPRLADVCAQSRESSEFGGARADAVRVLLEKEKTEAAAIVGELTGLLEKQMAALDTFNVVLFGRTGTGKSSLVEALTNGDGARVSPYGESDWTKDVEGAAWHGCRVFDTPGIGGWDKKVPPAQLERARLAAASANVVVLCFDNQNQRASEFQKVSEWIGEYDKAAVAVLNVRNERWGIADLVPDPAIRRGYSTQVAQHVQHLRDELARIGLNRIPIIALHARNAMFACATEPYEGPAQGTRADRLGRLSQARLYRCSNVWALETLLITVILQGATPLRLGSVNRLVVGAVQEAVRRTAELVRRAEEPAEVHEAGIARALETLGLPEPAEDDHDYAAFRVLLGQLEELRESRFQVPFVARAERYATDLITSKLAPLEAAAQHRADGFVEAAMLQRRTPKAGAFESAVFWPAEMNTAIAAALSEFEEYLAARFELIAQDARSDLSRLTLEQEQVRIRASAGRALYATSVGSQVAGIGAFAGVAYATAIVNAWNPVGWTAFGLAAAATAAGLLLEGGGVVSRRKAVDRRERASGQARADGRKAVRDAFARLEELLGAEFDSLLRQALVDNLAQPLTQAIAFRRIAAAGTVRTNLLTRFLEEVLPAAGVPQDLMSEAVRECETQHRAYDAAGRRGLWLGESWLEDPAGPVRARTASAPARTDVRHELERFAATRGTEPRPGSGREQLRAAAREPFQQGLLPGPAAAQDRAGHGPAGAGGQGDDPQLRERGGIIPGPGRAEHGPVRRRVREVHQHPVGGEHRHPGQQHRRRLAVPDERPGRLPEQVLHHVRWHQDPPVRDDFLRGHMPFQGERDVREQPRQAGQRLAIRPVRHQDHREHQTDDQRIRHQPAPLPRPQPPRRDRLVHDGLDHAVAEVAFQLAQSHQVRQPRVRQHRPVPAHHRGRGHHRPAEHRQLARRRSRLSRRDRAATANQQVSGPHHHSARRSPGDRELRRPDCISGGTQARLHKGLL